MECPRFPWKIFLLVYFVLLLYSKNIMKGIGNTGSNISEISCGYDRDWYYSGVLSK